MLPELIEVITTAAEQSDAQAIAAMLVEKRLAACTQVSGPIESRYWWNDRIEIAREWQVIVKTQGEMYPAVEEAIRGVHPYDVPEVLARPIVGVSPAYRMWLLGQLAIPPKVPPEPAPPEPAPPDAEPADKLTESTLTRSKRAKKEKKTT